MKEVYVKLTLSNDNTRDPYRSFDGDQEDILRLTATKTCAGLVVKISFQTKASQPRLKKDSVIALTEDKSRYPGFETV